jgi:hypothetical protein
VDSDNVLQFLQETRPEKMVLLKSMHENYQTYYVQAGISQNQTLGKHKFRARLEHLGYEVVKGKREGTFIICPDAAKQLTFTENDGEYDILLPCRLIFRKIENVPNRCFFRS